MTTLSRSIAVVRMIAKSLEVGAHVGRDRILNPLATCPQDVPWSAEAITVDWLTAVLCGEHPGARVRSVELGTGSAGSTVRRQLLLEYNDEGERLVTAGAGKRAALPRSVFAKMTPTWRSRLAYGISESMSAEACFFNEIRPQLTIEAPWGYHASYDLRTFRSIQLMEDLVTTCRADFCTPTTNISLENAEDMVSTLATLHGRFSQDPRLDNTYQVLKSFPTWYQNASAFFNLNRYHNLAMEKAADVIPKDVHRRRAEIWPTSLRVLEAHDRLPRTLLHSDVHLGNWYITASGRMGLCDWGCVVKGNGARDFAYAISASLPIEDRRAWERHLLEFYLDRLACAGGERITFDEAWLRYRQHLFCALLMWTPTLCHSPFLPEMQPESVAMEMIGRITTAMSDVDSLSSVP